MVYYSGNDLCYGMHLDKIVDLIIPTIDSISLNDAIEFFQMKKYFDEDARLLSWSNEEYASYKVKQKSLTSLCFRYFYALNDSTIVTAFSSIEYHYTNAFWELFEQCKLYEKISDSAFQALLHEKYIHPHDIFGKQNIVARYGAVLKEFILTNFHLIHIVIDAYEQEYNGKGKLYLPSELTGTEICDYISCYIDSKEAGLNILQSIYQMKPTKAFPVTDVIRMRAKRKYDEQTKDIFEREAKMGFTTTIAFAKNQNEVIVENISGNEAKLSYSTDWLLDTLDNPSILNNFIYLFNYVDYQQMRCLLVNHPCHMTPMERIFQNRGLSCCYPANSMVFHTTNGLARLQMEAYYSFLEDNGTRLETVLSWFFTEYLQTEFNCPEMRIRMPSAGASYYEKCTAICTAFDAILQQFSLFVEHQEIDFDLISIASGGKKYNQIPSLVKGKYIYGTGKELKWLTNTLFSDQCTFAYVSRIYDQGKSYRSFFELLQNEDVFLSDYDHSEKAAFMRLAELGIISINDNGKMSLIHGIELFLLSDLYFNDVISKHYYPDSANGIITKWIAEGMLIEGDGLFSRQEADYLNYLLNRVEFINGLDLRNKYLHGVQSVTIDEKAHRDNYFILLIVLVIFAIKINDDFTIAEHVKSLKQNEEGSTTTK